MSTRVALLSLLAGCSVEVPLDQIEQAAKSPGGDDTCPVWGCGSNSPVLAAIEFYEANEAGLYNEQGFRIVGFELAGIRYHADVIDGELVARNPRNGTIAYRGDTVKGGRFEIAHERGTTYYLDVDDVGRMPLWARPHGVVWMTYTYVLAWRRSPVDTPTLLCGANPDPDDPTLDFHAVLYDDDRIHADAIEVTGETADWFTIGCAGSALAKQHLLGHTRAAGAITGTTTTLAERTANLKMITGDYCGRGDPFTVAGEPLRWRDEHAWYSSLPQQGGQIEARWTAKGAACLNTPRIDFNQTAAGLTVFPLGVEKLLDPSEGWCTAANPRPPACTGSMTDLEGAHVISVNL